MVHIGGLRGWTAGRHGSGLGLKTALAITAGAGGMLFALAASANAVVPFAATASVSPASSYIGDALGSVYTVTVTNTGSSATIGAVEVGRPDATWTITECLGQPAGWSVQTADPKCRFRSANGTSDDILPGESRTFQVRATTAPGTSNRTGTWSVVVSKSNHFDTRSLLKHASPAATGSLTTTLYTFQLTDAVVSDSPPAAGSACPAPNKTAVTGSTHTIVVCGRNRATTALTPVAAQSSLAGSFIGTAGTFSSGAIPAGSGDVVLARWTGTQITSSFGLGNKTVIARVGSASNRTSPLETFTGYSATNQPPVAGDDAYSTSEENALLVAAPGVLVNDTDADGDPISAVLDADVSHGLLALAPDGSFSYLPDVDFAGTDSFTYHANDGIADSNIATVTLTVSAVNDAPVNTVPGAQTLLEDGTRTFSSGGGNAITVTDADAGAGGVDVGLSVTQGTLTLGSTAGVTTTGNGTGAVSVSGPVTAVNSALNGLVYAPAADTSGSDVLSVLTSDNGNTGSGGALSDVDTVGLTVTAVNDVPSFTKGADESVLEDAGAQSVSGWASAISKGPADESGQSVDFVVSNDNNGLFSTQPAVSATGTLTYTLAADAFGSATVTVAVHDDGGTANGGDDTSDAQTFTITVAPVNDAPSFTGGGNLVSALEDSGAHTVLGWATALSAGPANESGQSLDFVVSNDNNALFSVQPAVDATTGDLTYTLAPDANGGTTISVALHDDGGTANGGVDTSASANPTLTVTAVNDVPSFTKGADESVLEDAGAQSVSGWASAISRGPADESGQSVDFVVSNDNNGLFSTQPAVSATGTLTYTLAADAYGSATVTVAVHDDGGTANGGDDTSDAQTFTITVAPVNDVPSFTKGADQVVIQDSGAQTVTAWATAISAGPANESGQTLAFTVTADDPTLFSAQPAVDLATGDLTYTPAAATLGSTTVHVVLTDDGGTANGGVNSVEKTFTITIGPANSTPTADATSASGNEDAGAITVNLSGDDADGDALTFTAGTATNGLVTVPTAAVCTGATPNHCTSTVTYTPNGNFFGADSFTYTVNDGTVDSSGALASITINPVNDPPTFTKGADQNVLEDAGAQSVSGWATAISEGPVNESGQTVTFFASSDNPGLFSAQPAIAPDGTLTYTPAADASGVATVSVNLQDDGGTTNGGLDTSPLQTFTITVAAVNDAPSFTKGADQALAEDAGAQSISNWATAISKGPADESAQTLSFLVTNDNNGLFSAQPAVSPTGTLTFTSGPNKHGSAIVSVRLQDSGGTSNGGVDTSALQTFTITIAAVNDPPVAEAKSFTVQANMKISLGGLLANAQDTADTGQNPGYTPTFTVASLNVGAGCIGCTVSNVNSAAGTFDFDPPAGGTGTHTFSYTIQDNGDPGPGINSVPTTITVTVNGPVIWFVDAAASPGGTGRLSAPFTTLASLAAVDAANHRAFVAQGTYTDAVTLENGEWLTGSGSKAASFDTLMGITPPAGTIARPVVNTTAPTLQGVVTLGSGNTLRGLNLTGSTALSGSSFGTLTLGSGANADVGLSSVGQALNLSTGTVSGDFVSTSSSGGTNNVLLNAVSSSGTSLGTGGLAGATSEGLKITGGAGTFSYGGTVANAGLATVSIANKTGGTVTLSGLVSDATGAGVSLSSNTGAVINLTGGVTLSSGTSPAFAATGGGTVSVTGAANTLASTTGTALNIANTTIGAADLTFRSISTNGAAKGIVLDSTGSAGNLIVTGNGGTCTAASTAGCSGGTIASSTGVDDSSASPVGTGIVLNNTRDVSLTRMLVSGASNYAVRGHAVTNLSLTDSVVNGTNGTNSGAPFNDGSMIFDGLTGTVSFTRVAVSGGFGSNIEVNDAAGTLNATFDALTVGANSTTDGNDGLQVEGTGTATVNATVQNSTFTSSRGDLVQYTGDGAGGGSFTMTGNTLSNSHTGIATGGGGVSLFGGAAGPVTMSISANTSRDAVGHAWLIRKSPGAGSMTGTFNGNTIGVAASANSGSREGDGLHIRHAGTGLVSWTVTNNGIFQYNGQGIMIQAGDGALAGGTLNAVVSGNTVSSPGNNPAVGAPSQGLHVNSGIVAGDTFTTCVDVGANSLTGSGRNGGTDFRARQRQSTTVRLPSYAGGSTDTGAVVTFLQGKIGGAPTGSASVQVPPGGGFVGSACGA